MPSAALWQVLDPAKFPAGAKFHRHNFSSCLISYNLVILPSWKEDGRITEQQFSDAVILGVWESEPDRDMSNRLPRIQGILYKS